MAFDSTVDSSIQVERVRAVEPLVFAAEQTILESSTGMPTFYIEQFGCRATQADAAAIEHQLVDRGYTVSRSASEAQVVVVNTCTVTASADTQARHAIGAIHRANPRATIVVTGCYAQRAPEELAALRGVAWVVGNSHKPDIPRILAAAGADFAAAGSAGQRSGSAFIPIACLDPDAGSLSQGPAKILTGNIFEHEGWLAATVLGGECEHTRPILKIQDGCNNRCAYCVIPFVRGRSRSLPPQDVLNEMNKLCASGFKEIVLSGINLGSYGRDLTPRVEFENLLRRICDETPIERLRISSVEPMDVTQDLVDFFASTERIARHFHLPLQSGSDRILAAMHRWYRAEHYGRRIELIRERLPDAAIGADVIAGFPGESEAEHRTTLQFLENLPLTYLHVFSFSKRPGTAAEKLAEEVPPGVVKQRSRELRAVGEEKRAEFHATQVGRQLRVLTLRHSASQAPDGWTPAISSNYLRVRLSGEWSANQMVNVLLTSATSAYLHASPVEAPL